MKWLKLEIMQKNIIILGDIVIISLVAARTLLLPVKKRAKTMESHRSCRNTKNLLNEKNMTTILTIMVRRCEEIILGL